MLTEIGRKIKQRLLWGAFCRDCWLGKPYVLDVAHTLIAARQAAGNAAAGAGVGKERGRGGKN